MIESLENPVAAGSYPTSAPFGGGLDKLEVRLPETVPFRPNVENLIAAARAGEIPAHTSKHYAMVLDLRPYSVDALLHVGLRHGKDHRHKLEVIESGRQSYRQLEHDLTRVVDTDPSKLEPMRIDLTTDVPDVPVSYFLRNARVEMKRFGAQIGTLTSEPGAHIAMGMRDVETIYHGKRPNCYRIYNKTAHWMSEYRKDHRAWERKMLSQLSAEDRAKFNARIMEQIGDKEQEMSPAGWTEYFTEYSIELAGMLYTKPSFESIYGITPDTILTRVERQIGAQQTKILHFPDDSQKKPIFRNLGELRKNVTEFNPFAAIELVPPGKPAPSPENYSLRNWLAGMHLRQMITEQGYAPTINWMKKYAKGNMDDILSALRDFIPAQEESTPGVITSPELFEQYRDAIRRQLAA